MTTASLLVTLVTAAGLLVAMVIAAGLLVTAAALLLTAACGNGDKIEGAWNNLNNITCTCLDLNRSNDSNYWVEIMLCSEIVLIKPIMR